MPTDPTYINEASWEVLETFAALQKQEYVS